MSKSVEEFWKEWKRARQVAGWWSENQICEFAEAYHLQAMPSKERVLAMAQEINEAEDLLSNDEMEAIYRKHLESWNG